MDIFFQIGLMIIIAAGGGLLARLFKQPMIPAYIIAGILIGPVFHIITNSNVIISLAEIGIAFLLFIVGLEIDLKKLKKVGAVALGGGLINIIILFSLGFLISSLLGFTTISSLYLGIVLCFSSTMVVVKILVDKRKIDTLHARIIVGILLLEDIIAIIALVILTEIGNLHVIALFNIFVKGFGVIIGCILLGKYVFPPIFRFAAKSPELLLLSALAVLFTFSGLFYLAGFSIIIGAFIAGVSLGNLPYYVEIVGKVRSLRDFFSTIFFVSLGMELVIGNGASIILPLIVFTILIILIKPFILMIITSLFGYKKRTSFLTGVSLSQISEFSLIIITQGMLLGHVPKSLFTITVLLAMITIIATSYIGKLDEKMYRKMSKVLGFLDKLGKGKRKELILKEKKYDVVLCGYDRIGYNIFKTLKKMKKSFIVIDFNPDIINRLIRKGVPCIYGDISDDEVLNKINLKNVEMIISTVPELDDNILLIKKIRRRNSKTIIFVTAYNVDDALKLYDVGADYVILPHFLGGAHVSFLIEDMGGDITKVLKNKFNHINELKERKLLGHEHPSREEKESKK